MTGGPSGEHVTQWCPLNTVSSPPPDSQYSRRFARPAPLLCSPRIFFLPAGVPVTPSSRARKIASRSFDRLENSGFLDRWPRTVWPRSTIATSTFPRLSNACPATIQSIPDSAWVNAFRITSSMPLSISGRTPGARQSRDTSNSTISRASFPGGHRTRRTRRFESRSLMQGQSVSKNLGTSKRARWSAQSTDRGGIARGGVPRHSRSRSASAQMHATEYGLRCVHLEKSTTRIGFSVPHRSRTSNLIRARATPRKSPPVGSPINAERVACHSKDHPPRNRIAFERSGLPNGLRG